MAVRWTCNAPEEPLDGRETARKVVVHLGLSKNSWVSAFLIALGKGVQTLILLGKEPTAHSVLSPIPADYFHFWEPLLPSRASDLASHFSDNWISQLTFSQALFFLVFKVGSWTEPLCRLSLGNLQTDILYYRQILSVLISSSIKFGLPGKSEMSMWAWELEGIGLFQDCREGLGWLEGVQTKLLRVYTETVRWDDLHILSPFWA